MTYTSDSHESYYVHGQHLCVSVFCGSIRQEAQLPQRNSAAAAHVYLHVGWLTDILMITLGGSVHRTRQNRRGCTLKRSDSKSAGRKTEFDMKYPLKVIQGHSFCNQLPAHNWLRIVIYIHCESKKTGPLLFLL